MLLVSGPLSAGATAIYASNLMTGLTREGVEHPLLTPEPPGIGLLSRRESASVHPAKGLSWAGWRPFVFRKILAWAREQTPTVMHGLSEHSATICARLAEKLQLPCVLSLQNYAAAGDVAELRRSKFCQALIVPSEPLREHAVNKLHFQRELVRVIEPGVPVAPRRRETADEETLCRAQLVVSIGSFSAQSDFATFIEAVRHIADKTGEACSFVLAGDGPREPQLRKFVRELKLDKLATFCHGHTEIDRLLGEADVYVQTTRREGFAIRALQAMAQGVPVVAATNSAVLELVEDGVNGFVVPPANHALLAEKVLALLQDSALRASMGEAGRKTAETQFNEEKMMQATLSVYRDLEMT